MLNILLLAASFAFQAETHAQDHAGEHAPAETQFENRLKDASSPYLLQHAHNPVDWYEWGDEALKKARDEDKPIFLSVGYSACHWCHVMAHESFESEEIAAVMNEYFVCIKVDREERPDIDRIYMAAAQRMMNGSGGWPLSVWMTPDLEPFYAGTYFPPEEKYGRPGFKQICEHTNSLWKDKREQVVRFGQNLIDQLRKQNAPGEIGSEQPGEEVWAKVDELVTKRFDPVHGGFGEAPRWAPKFPRCTELVFMLRHGHRAGNELLTSAVETTLTKMAQGGIYDQIGGGFARYSVDRTWTVPHFEKMLYDNSQLAQLYMEAWQATGNDLYKRIATEILDYVDREMTGAEGGFYSTTDADSEGHEGKFFVWTPDEIRTVCGDDAPVAIHHYGVTKGGNFEGKNILTGHRTLAETAAATNLDLASTEAALARCRAALYAAREKRVHPHLDDKILSSWNGMMLSAFARGSIVFSEPRYLAIAQRNADFLLTKMRREDGSLFRTRRVGESRLQAFLEDYASVANGLIDLYEADLDLRWLRAAIELYEFVEKNFVDESGSYVNVLTSDSSLPVQLSGAQESSLPSDVGTAATVAYRLGLLSGRTAWLDRVDSVLAKFKTQLEWYPSAYGQLMILFEFRSASPKEIYFVGDQESEVLRAELGGVRWQWPPHRVLSSFEATTPELEKLLPAVAGKVAIDGEPAVYECTHGVCKAPRALSKSD